MKSQLVPGLLALSLIAAGNLQAQDRPAREGMGTGPMRQQQNTIEWLLTQKAQFRPSAEQVAKLEELAKQLNEAVAKQREEMQKLREGGDRREAFQKIRPLMDEIRKKDDEVAKEALEVLNDEQKKVVEDLLAERRKEMDARRPRMRGAAA